jgi:hypothetical protein
VRPWHRGECRERFLRDVLLQCEMESTEGKWSPLSWFYEHDGSDFGFCRSTEFLFQLAKEDVESWRWRLKTSQ